MAQCKRNKEFRIRLASERHKIRVIELAKMKQCTITALITGYIIDAISKEPIVIDFKEKNEQK